MAIGCFEKVHKIRFCIACKHQSLVNPGKNARLRVVAINHAILSNPDTTSAVFKNPGDVVRAGRINIARFMQKTLKRIAIVPVQSANRCHPHKTIFVAYGLRHHALQQTFLSAQQVQRIILCSQQERENQDNEEQNGPHKLWINAAKVALIANSTINITY